jgi:hypothetical protein
MLLVHLFRLKVVKIKPCGNDHQITFPNYAIRHLLLQSAGIAATKLLRSRTVFIRNPLHAPLAIPLLPLLQVCPGFSFVKCSLLMHSLRVL